MPSRPIIERLVPHRGVIAMSGGVIALLAVIVIAGGHGVIGASRGALAVETLIVVVHEWAVAGAVPLAYILGSLGLGRWATRRLSLTCPGSLAVAIAIGLAASLSASHLLGMIGAFGALGALGGGLIGRGASWLVTAVGLVLLARTALHARELNAAKIPLPSLLAVPAIGIIAVAVCVPPGVLWSSEFGGYDALSYHLQLPREWLALGRVWPVDHNVYSYLPGYMESAYYNISVMSGADADTFAGGAGRMLISAQILHALTGALASLALASLCARACLAGRPERDASAPASMAAAIFLTTPWTVVTATLAYNEMPVIAMGAGAMSAAFARKARPAVKGALCGFIVAGCCGAKMTSILLVAPAVGIAILATTDRRAWLPAIVACALAGAIGVAPWLIRNAIASGNPVFPFLHGIFGDGHWSAEQHARYASSHAFDGTVLDRFRLLVMPADGTTEHRGALHQQWGIFFPTALVFAAVAISSRLDRRAATFLAAGLALQLLAWLFATHLQSRFLLPMTLTCTPIIALGLQRLSESRVRFAGPGAGALLVLIQSGVLWWTWVHQARGRPAEAMFVGAAGLNGSLIAEQVAASPAHERDTIAARLLLDASPTQFVNLALPRGSTVYFIGESAVLYDRGPMVYNATWDDWAVVDAIKSEPDAVGVTLALRARAIDYIMIDFGEIDRLLRSGYADPVLGGEGFRAWVESLGEPIRAWGGGQSTAIFDISRVAPATGGGG